MAFDYGAEVATNTGGGFKNPAVGAHTARLVSLIHLGNYQERFGKDLKDACNEVLAVFELKDEEDFEEDGVTPLYISKPFPLKSDPKSFMNKLINALDADGSADGFDDLINRPCQIEVSGSKELNDDGLPKYVNFAGISSMLPKFAKFVEEAIGGVGHVKYADMTTEAILSMTSFQVQDYLVGDGTNPKGGINLSFKGSKAEELLAEIRVDNPTFGMKKEKSDDDKTKAKETPKAEETVRHEVVAQPEMDENEDF